jgi:microcompartment protein CcmL/EutN
MPKALGLIETRGLVAAIVAADTMLKTANVTLAGRESADAGLITVKVLGDTASVKAAVEAASSAVANVGELISAHVIPRPDDGLISIFPEIADEEMPAPGKKEGATPAVREQKRKISVKKIVKSEKPKPVAKKKNEPKTGSPVKTVDKTDKPKIKEETSQITLFDVENETVTDISEEPVVIKEDKIIQRPAPKKSEQQPGKESVIIKSEKDILDLNLDALDVHQLRRLARSVEGFPIQGRQISRANRKILIEYFKNLV